MSNNYKLFYSNQFTEGNAISIIIKTKDEPKYITNSNFLLDSDAFKEVFGDIDFLDQIADALGLKDDKKKNDENDVVDHIIKIYQVTEEIKDKADMVLKGAKLLYTVLTYEYNQNVEKFNDYVKEQIELLDEDNIDIFYEHIGDNMYVKNYIGFRSVEDINKFMRFDYNIYKKKFPSFNAAIGAILGASLLLSFFLYLLFFLFCCGKQYFSYNSNLSKCWTISGSIIFYGFALGYFIYALCIYFRVNKNKSLDELKSIKSDEFITNLIDDFISECQESTLIIISLFLISLSIIIHIISLIFYSKLLKSYS